MLNRPLRSTDSRSVVIASYRDPGMLLAPIVERADR